MKFWLDLRLLHDTSSTVVDTCTVHYFQSFRKKFKRLICKYIVLSFAFNATREIGTSNFVHEYILLGIALLVKIGKRCLFDQKKLNLEGPYCYRYFCKNKEIFSIQQFGAGFIMVWAGFATKHWRSLWNCSTLYFFYYIHNIQYDESFLFILPLYSCII